MDSGILVGAGITVAGAGSAAWGISRMVQAQRTVNVGELVKVAQELGAHGQLADKVLPTSVGGLFGMLKPSQSMAAADYLFTTPRLIGRGSETILTTVGQMQAAARPATLGVAAAVGGALLAGVGVSLLLSSAFDD